MTHDATSAAIAVASLSLLAGGAHGQSAVEISEDARRAVFPAFEPADAGAQAEGAGSLPFGATPDFQIDLRRQVGGLAIADMNADGFNDIVVVCYISNSFPPYDDWREMIFYGSAAGPSSVPGWVSDNETHAGDVQIGDINGDTHPDMVVVRGGGVRTDPLQIYFGSPAGPATSPGFNASFARRQWGTAGDLVDIDSDGDLDVVTTGQGLSPDPFRPVLLFRNDAGALNPVPAWQSGAEEISNGVTHADLLDIDSNPELIVAKWVNFQSGVLREPRRHARPVPVHDGPGQRHRPWGAGGRCHRRRVPGDPFRRRPRDALPGGARCAAPAVVGEPAQRGHAGHPPARRGRRRRPRCCRCRLQQRARVSLPEQRGRPGHHPDLDLRRAGGRHRDHLRRSQPRRSGRSRGGLLGQHLRPRVLRRGARLPRRSRAASRRARSRGCPGVHRRVHGPWTRSPTSPRRSGSSISRISRPSSGHSSPGAPEQAPIRADAGDSGQSASRPTGSSPDRRSG
jgi:hypothetical protein